MAETICSRCAVENRLQPTSTEINVIVLLNEVCESLFHRCFFCCFFWTKAFRCLSTHDLKIWHTLKLGDVG